MKRYVPPEASELARVVFVAIGAASVCWSEAPRSAFDSEQATKVGNELIERIVEITGFGTLPDSLTPEDIEQWLNH